MLQKRLRDISSAVVSCIDHFVCEPWKVDVGVRVRVPGQVYYALLKERRDRGIKNVAISRLEQISPFPYEMVRITNTFPILSLISIDLGYPPTSTNIPMPTFFGAKYVPIISLVLPLY